MTLMYLGDFGFSVGLAFHKPVFLNMTRISCHAVRVMKKHGFSMRGCRKVSDRHAVLQFDEMRIHLVLCPDPDQDGLDAENGRILHVCLEQTLHTVPKTGLQAVFRDLARRLSDLLEPDSLFWTAEGEDGPDLPVSGSGSGTPDRSNLSMSTVPKCGKAQRLPRIESEVAQLQRRAEREALKATGFLYSSAETANKGGKFGLIPETAENTAPKIEDIRDDNDIVRLSAWLLSIGVAMIALPVGIALFVINLIKGENLRLVSQVSALMGLFVSLSVSGASADTLSLLEAVLM